MTDVTSIAKASLYALLTEGESSPLDPSEYADYIFALNNFMADLESREIVLGFTTVDNIADEVTVPPGAIRGIVSNMAIEMAPQFGRPVPPELYATAETGMNTLRRIAQQQPQTGYHPNLPRGSGRFVSTNLASELYSDQSNCMLVMSGNALLTDIVTISTPVKVRGFWEQARNIGYNIDVTGRVTYTGEQALDISVTINTTVTGAGTYELLLAKNGSTIAATATASGTALTHALTIHPGEYLEVFIQDTAGTTDPTVTDGRIEIV